MIRRVGAILAAGALALGLAACSQGNQQQQPPPPPEPFGAQHDWGNGNWVKLDQPGVNTLQPGDLHSMRFNVTVHNGAQNSVDAHQYRVDVKYNDQVHSFSAFGTPNTPGAVVDSNQNMTFAAIGEAPPPGTHVVATVSGANNVQPQEFAGDTPKGDTPK